MIAVFGDIGFTSSPFWADIVSVVKGRAFSKVSADHGFHGRLHTVHKDICFRGHIGFLEKRPAELAGSSDHLLNRLIALVGPIQSDMGDSKLTDLGFAARFMINVKRQPKQPFEKTHNLHLI
ncbi:hypothetical protein LDFHOB_13475 [Candidatus Electronema aureum]